MSLQYTSLWVKFYKNRMKVADNSWDKSYSGRAGKRITTFVP